VTAPADAAHWIAERIREIDAGGTKPKIRSDQEWQENIRGFLSDITAGEPVLHALFPDRVPADLTFYGRLREVFWPPDRWETGGRFLGAIWSLAVRKLSNEEAEQLLLAAGAINDPFYFVILSAMPALLEQIEIRPGFACEGFRIIARGVPIHAIRGKFITIIATENFWPKTGFTRAL
jgi:hypothetical protein